MSTRVERKDMHRFTKQFTDYCERTLQFDKQVSYAYQSLPICIIDCVYSLRTKYDPTTLNIVKRYAKHYMNGDPNAPGETVSDLIAHIEEVGGPVPFATEVVENRQLSGNVLKSEICLQLARYLRYLHIETIEDFRQFEAQELLEIVIRAVKGLGDAGVNYLFMLAGDPNRCKPDVHIHHCIKDACGEDVSNEECQILFRDATEILKKKHPFLTVAKLDGIIWRKYAEPN